MQIPRWVAMFVFVLCWSTLRTAHAQVYVATEACTGPLCPTPAEYASYEAEARADRQLEENARRSAWERVNAQRQMSWEERSLAQARARVPAPVKLGFPSYEFATQGVGRLWSNGTFQLGGNVAARLVLNRVSVEVEGSLAMTRPTESTASRARFAAWTVEPAVGYVLHGRTWRTHGRILAGVILGGPLDDQGRAASTLLGGKLVAAESWRLLQLPNGGYLGLDGRLEMMVLGGLGGGNALRGPLVGVGFGLGVVVAL